MRRPFGTALLLFLVFWLAVRLWLPSYDSGEAKGRKAAGAACPAGTKEETDSAGWETLAGKEAVLLGKASGFYESADRTDETISFTLSNISVTIPGISENIPLEEKKRNKAVCYGKAGSSLPKAGSWVKVSGRLEEFRQATNPGEFDAAAYYKRQGYAFCLYDAQILEEGASYDRISEGLYQIKRSAAVFFSALLGKKDGAAASAMVLGVKKDMDADLKALYQDAGISHLLAISGLHISLIGMGLFSLLRKCRLPLGSAAFLSAGFLLLYAQMTGMGVSTKRAVCMFFLMLLAKLAGRTADMSTSLSVAACVILLPNPEYIRDAGFCLSFSAVAGIAVVVPMLQERGLRRAEEQTRRQKLLEKLYKSLAASFGITLAMLPFLLSFYYKWNPWSVLANLFVIPLMGLLLPYLLFLAAVGQGYMAASGALPGAAQAASDALPEVAQAASSAFPGAAAQALSGVLPEVGASAALPLWLQLLALPARGIFFLYEKICECIIRLPGSSLHTGMPKGWQLLLFLAGLAALVAWGRKLRPLLRLTAACLLTAVFLIRLPGNLQITMLDVGQGECVFVQTPGQDAWLLDAGSTSNKKAGQYQIVPFLEYSGIRRLNGIFVSHWDEDHINALEELFSWAKTDHVKIGRLYLPDTELEDEALEELLALAEDFSIPAERLQAGQTMTADGFSLTCLHPYAGERQTDRNAVSLVLKLDYGEFSALFTGDLQEEGERWLADEYGGRLDCDLLDAGHHGAANATTQELLDFATPRAVLISCGRNNRYGHPAPSTLERLKEQNVPYYVTAGCGAVTVTVEKDGMKIAPFLSAAPGGE